MAATSIDTETVVIHFGGGMADIDAIPLEDLIESLEGFRDFFALSDNMFVQQRLTLKVPSADRRIQIRVRRIGPGRSIEAVIDFVGLNMAAGLIQAGTVGGTLLVARALWKWRRSLIESRIRRPALWSLEEAAAAFEVMAREAGLEPSNDASDDPGKIVQQIDRSLREAASPIARSVDSIRIESDAIGSPITFGRNEKASLESEPVQGYEAVASTEWEEHLVEFKRIHPERATASIAFMRPVEEDQKGVKSCTIVDKRIAGPRDPYTRALHERKPIKAWCRKAILNPTIGSIRWEITLSPPAVDESLFG